MTAESGHAQRQPHIARCAESPRKLAKHGVIRDSRSREVQALSELASPLRPDRHWTTVWTEGTSDRAVHLLGHRDHSTGQLDGAIY